MACSVQLSQVLMSLDLKIKALRCVFMVPETELQEYSESTIRAIRGFLITRYSTVLVENCLTQWRLSVFTTTRSLWGQGAPWKGVLNQGKWQRAQCVWLKLPQRTPVRGIGTFSHFR